MELTGQQLIPATLDITWIALNDPGTLKSCISGCESIEKTGDSDYAVVMAVKIGPVNAKFKGRLTLTNLHPPQAYSIVFEGQGGIAGFGKGTANVTLTAIENRTRLDYAAVAQVGGKIAQIGSRLVDAAARKIADEFFTALNRRLGGGSADIASHER
ncbi:MAG: carbon monoxide dehydrogenase subunit G [Burkholderiaceae bacterium]